MNRKTFVHAALLLTLAATPARAQINAGEQKPEMPFTTTEVPTFNLPWRIAFPPSRITFDGKGGATPANAGASATAFATSLSPRTARFGWWKTSIPAGCLA